MQEYNADMKKIGFSVILATIVLLAVPVASAQSDAQVLQSVRACQGVTGLSERLACYDRVLPPGTNMVGTVSAARSSETVNSNASAAPSRERELEATVAELEQQLQIEEIGTRPIARIIEVERPTLRTSRLIADDGRVFLESVTTSIINWPDTPFEVDVNRSITGTYTIRAINSAGDRGLGRGYRVRLER